MVERILFVCIGQAGSNIGKLFNDLNYNCLFINTSYEDLETIDAKHKLHIVGAFGCNKDRQKALNYAKDYYDTIINVIDTKFPQQDIVYFIFSLGGGTGSGLSPIILDIMTHKNPNKNYGAIVILPSTKESIKSQINAVEAYKQVTNIESLRSLYVLDNNNNMDKFEINKKFVNLFDKFVNVTNADARGLIDRAEVETMLTCKGNSIISDDINAIVNKQYNNNIFTQYEYGCKYIGMSISSNIDINEIESSLGTPLDTFVGYGDRNLIISTGMSYPHKRIEQLLNIINAKQNDIPIIHDTLNIQIPKIKNNYDFKETKPEEKISFSKLFAKYTE
jgi:hypothetical protein